MARSSAALKDEGLDGRSSAKASKASTSSAAVTLLQKKTVSGVVVYAGMAALEAFIKNPPRMADGVPCMPLFEITPEMARKIQQDYMTEHQRKRSRRYVQRYAKDMDDSAWSITASGIGFNTFGVLCDGGHRITAAAESTKGFVAHVAFGVLSKAMNDIDIGKRRSPGDKAQIIAIFATASQNALGSALITFDYYDKAHDLANRQWANIKIDEYYNESINPEAAKWAVECAAALQRANKYGVTLRNLVYVLYCAYQENPYGAELFVAGWRGEPVKHQKVMDAFQTQVKGSKHNRSASTYLFWLGEAWKAFVQSGPVNVGRLFTTFGPMDRPDHLVMFDK